MLSFREGRRRLRRRWYAPGRTQTLRYWLALGGWRDVMMFVVTGLVAVALVAEERIQGDVRETRRTAVQFSCDHDRAQDDVLRALIVASLSDEHGQEYVRQHELAEQLLAPLGGIELTSEEAKVLCDRRFEAAGLLR